MDALEKFKDSKYIFIVGIGGSDLASKAVWRALTLHKPETNKKLFFLESPDSREYEEVQYFAQNEIFAPEQTALLVISKSGKTAETLEAFHKIFDILSEKFGGSVNDRVLVISTNNSPLWELARSRSLKFLEWGADVGGRFSAFTVAHTTVLSISGFNVEAFVSGGSKMKETLLKQAGDNLAFHLAQNIFENYNKGTHILDFFIFNSELEDLGKWCRQLVAESLGKENEKGQRVGITPTVSIGPSDLHSMLQLDLGGPKNKFTLFIKSIREISESVNEKAYMDAIRAYEKAELPFEKYEMSEISEEEIGKFMAFMMAVTIELANLLLVNPYDQPAVEEYKKHLIDNK